MKTPITIFITAVATAVVVLALSARAKDESRPSGDGGTASGSPRDPALKPPDRFVKPLAKRFPADGGVAPRSEAAAADADVPEPTRAEMFDQIATILKQKGTTNDDVMTITIPRDDLIVTVEGQDVPVAAGLESQFRFYQCPCGGKISVVGSFVTLDYEANNVVDALREGHLVVASVGPFLTYEQPKLTMVRFQGEAKPEEMGTVLKKALEWVGEQRGKPQRLTEEKE